MPVISTRLPSSPIDDLQWLSLGRPMVRTEKSASGGIGGGLLTITVYGMEDSEKWTGISSDIGNEPSANDFGEICTPGRENTS
ncbi:MAG: hypothetical protein WA667_16075 [Candidatus Nitrosopolaris sp.]